MKKKLIIAALAVMVSSGLSAQLRVNKESIIRNSEGSLIGLQELMELMKSKKYTLVAVPGKDNEFVLKTRVGDEPMIQGTSKPFYGSGDFYDQFYGKAAPAFNLTTIDGKKMNLADLKGKTIVMNFWFTRCKPCIEEMPELNKLVDKFKDNKNVIFLSVALDSPDEIRSFTRQREFNYQHAGDAEKNGIIADYGIKSYPTNIIIDKEGKVCYAANGSPSDAEGLARYINRMAEVVTEVLK